MTLELQRPGDLAVSKTTPAAFRSDVAVNVSFAGHRNLDPLRLRGALDLLFPQLKAAFAQLAASPGLEGGTLDQAHSRALAGTGATASVTLITGLADGADQVAIDLWRHHGMGRIHALVPYSDPQHPDRHAWTDTPGNDPATRVDVAEAKASGRIDDWTVLDGMAGETAFPPRHPHLEQSRWLVRWSELVVVAWDGKPAGGPGGTADTVSLAIASGQPLIWIDTSAADRPPMLVKPERLFRDGSWEEWRLTLQSSEALSAGLLVPASADTIAEALIPRFALPASPVELQSYSDYLAGEPAFPLLLRMLNAGLTKVWRKLYASLEPEKPTQPLDYPSHPAIKQAMQAADQRANRLGNVHRAAQVALLLVSVLAVAFGTLPAIVPDAKILAVSAELAIIVLAQAYYIALTRRRTQFLWSDARRLAERLRALHTLWPLGVDFGDERSEPAATWTDWQARVLRRTIGPPIGALHASRLRACIVTARDDPWGIVAGQARYHQLTHTRLHRLHERLRVVERYGFRGLVLAILLFLGWMALSYGLHLFDKPPGWAGGILLFFSAVLPAVAAACMGIEAKLGLLDGARRSEALTERFERYVSRLSRPSGPPSTPELPLQAEIEVLNDAATTLVADVDKWRDSAAQRSIVTT